MRFTEERWTLEATFDSVAEVRAAGSTMYEGGPGEAAEFCAWCRKQAEDEWGFLAEEIGEGVEMDGETVRVTLNLIDTFDAVFRWLLGSTIPQSVTLRRTEPR